MRLSMVEDGGDGVLAGRMRGRADWDRLLPEPVQLSAGRIVEIDFARVRLVTGSYLAGGVLAAWPRSREVGFFPILTSVKDDIREDLAIALRDQNLTAWASRTESPVEAELLGADLEPALLRIIEQAADGPVSAIALHEGSKEQVGRTAWSNRLAVLEEHRLLRSFKSGRKLYYDRPWQEVEGG